MIPRNKRNQAEKSHLGYYQAAIIRCFFAIFGFLASERALIGQSDVAG
jgi:hypothetical protein